MEPTQPLGGRATAFATFTRFLTAERGPKTERQKRWVVEGATAVKTVLMMLLLLNIENSRLSMKGIQQRRELQNLRSDCVAADNLPLSAQILVSSTAAEHPDFPIKALTLLPEWKAFQNRLTGYAERIKLMEAQDLEVRHEMEHRQSWMWSVTLVLAITAVMLQRLKKEVLAAKIARS